MMIPLLQVCEVFRRAVRQQVLPSALGRCRVVLRRLCSPAGKFQLQLFRFFFLFFSLTCLLPGIYIITTFLSFRLANDVGLKGIILSLSPSLSLCCCCPSGVSFCLRFFVASASDFACNYSTRRAVALSSQFRRYCTVLPGYSVHCYIYYLHYRKHYCMY